MFKRVVFIVSLFLILVLGVHILRTSFGLVSTDGAPPFGEPEENIPKLGIYSYLSDWRRPEGPPRVALQAGHWKNDELPEELKKLKTSTGSSGGGKSEWEVNLGVAKAIVPILEKRGVVVDILPATVPSSYWADVFVAIHTDGSTSLSKSGFKVAAPWRDYTGKASDLVSFLIDSYSEATGLSSDPNITRNMRGYYAFSWWRYEHAIHPMTTAAIIELGFLTNFSDRSLLIKSPEVPAQGIARGVVNFLVGENLLSG